MNISVDPVSTKHAPDGTRAPSLLRASLLSGAVVGLAFLLRFWGIGWALPLKKAHIDEAVVIFYTMHFFTGDLNPHVFFDYPTLQLYIDGLAFYASFLAGKAAGVFTSLDQFVGIYLNGDASFLYLIARAISALFGTASVYITYLIGRRHFTSGIIPALLLAVLPIHVLHGHYATVDVGCVFFLLCAFSFIGAYYRRNQLRDLYIGSFILGLAAAVKYYPFVFFLPLAVSLFILERKVSFRKSATAGALGIAGFLSGCPYALLDFSAFSARFIDRFQLIVWGGGGAGSTFAAPDGFGLLPVLKNLFNAMTFPLSIVIVAGIVSLAVFARDHRKEYLIWLSYPVTYVLFLSTWKIASAHYLLPAIPFLLLAGVSGITMIPRLDRRVAYGLFLLLCLVPLARSVRTDLLLTKTDTRLLAYQWIKENISPGSRILRFPYTPEFMPSDPYRVRVDWDSKSLQLSPETLSSSYDFIICSAFAPGAVNAWERTLLTRYRIVRNWQYVPLASFHNPRITIYGKKE